MDNEKVITAFLQQTLVRIEPNAIQTVYF